MNVTGRLAYFFIAAAVLSPAPVEASDHDAAESATVVVYAQETEATTEMRLAKRAHRDRIVLLELVSTTLRSYPFVSALRAPVLFRAPELQIVTPDQLTPDLKLPELIRPERPRPKGGQPPGS